MENIEFEGLPAEVIEMLIELKEARETGDKLFDKKMYREARLCYIKILAIHRDKRLEREFFSSVKFCLA